MNYHVNSIRYIEQQVEFSKVKTPLLESAMDEPTVKKRDLWKMNTADQLRTHRLKN